MDGMLSSERWRTTLFNRGLVFTAVTFHRSTLEYPALLMNNWAKSSPLTWKTVVEWLEALLVLFIYQWHRDMYVDLWPVSCVSERPPIVCSRKACVGLFVCIMKIGRCFRALSLLHPDPPLSLQKHAKPLNVVPTFLQLLRNFWIACSATAPYTNNLIFWSINGNPQLFLT